ncbi:Uncharacterized protein FKW44_002841 [Caligus rogercresseyi]|uniref:CCHC-type domain-containing protein n=1 Tax=Caligus rogercresseyi TaxID=217165 RepID=A0A7T8QWP1_CALRO|nr:Uncharacterized protein FKW44_002841 [Caligus rogercresseyi]
MKSSISGERSAELGCYECGGAHLRRDCPSTRCFGCGERGHIHRNCTKNRDTRGNGEGTMPAPSTSRGPYKAQ